jgi:hypothetical protein
LNAAGEISNTLKKKGVSPMLLFGRRQAPRDEAVCLRGCDIFPFMAPEAEIEEATAMSSNGKIEEYEMSSN